MLTVTLGTMTLLAPKMLIEFSSERESFNIIHRIIGRANPDVTLNPSGLRTGSLGFLCASLADAIALENLHATHSDVGPLLLEYPELPQFPMTYVLSGSVRMELEDEQWIVRLDYTEVNP